MTVVSSSNALLSPEIFEKALSDFKIHGQPTPDLSATFETLKETKEHSIVVLSDGSNWQVARTANAALQSIFSTWTPGDEIRIKKVTSLKEGDNVKFLSNHFILKNAKTGAALFANSLPDFNKNSQTRFIKEVDPSGYSVITDDGKMWVLGYFGACNAMHWRAGDRVIVNKSDYSYRYKDYTMIHIQGESDPSPQWVTQVFENIIH